MAETILALNAGSSTLKYTLFDCASDGDRDLGSATLKSREFSWPDALELVLASLAKQGLPEPSLVGHRVVHGGALFTAPVRVDRDVLGQLESLVSLSPLHLPQALTLMRAALDRFPGVPQVACFDTAFHKSLPEVASTLALPRELLARGIRRYGFHGLSYESVLSVLGSPPPARLIVAHLGSGASLAAISQGRSMDTSMGLTPTGGLPMATRSGDLDPGLLVHLLREPGASVDRLEQLLNHESGLKGLAGSADMSELLARIERLDGVALAAVELFAYAVKKQIGAYFAALGGLDCLVFTGGIGENAPLVRELACRGLQGLGIELDASLNAKNAEVISHCDAPCLVRVVASNEQLVIARAAHAWRQGWSG